MTILRHYLKLLSLPLTLFAVYFLLALFWDFFNFPEAAQLMEMIRSWFAHYGLPVLFISSIVESMLMFGSYFPGVFVIFISAIFARSIEELTLVVSVATLGLLIGHLVSYLLGRYGWYKLLIKFGLRKSIEVAQEKLISRGPLAIFLSYWLPSLGALMDTAAGVIQMKFRTFLTYSVISSVFWNSLVAGVIYVVGEKAIIVAAPGSQGNFIPYTAIGIWIVILLIWDWRKNRKDKA